MKCAMMGLIAVFLFAAIVAAAPSPWSPVSLANITLTPHNSDTPRRGISIENPHPFIPPSFPPPPFPPIDQNTSKCVEPDCGPISAVFNPDNGIVKVGAHGGLHHVPISLTREKSRFPPLWARWHDPGKNKGHGILSLQAIDKTFKPDNATIFALGFLSLPEVARLLFEAGRIPSPSVLVAEKCLVFGGFNPNSMEPDRLVNGAPRGEPLYTYMNTTIPTNLMELIVQMEINLKKDGIYLPAELSYVPWALKFQNLFLSPSQFTGVENTYMVGRAILKASVLLLEYPPNGTILHHSRILPGSDPCQNITGFFSSNTFNATHLPKIESAQVFFNIPPFPHVRMSQSLRTFLTILITCMCIIIVISGCRWSWNSNHKFWPDRAHQRCVFGWYVPDEEEWYQIAKESWLGKKFIVYWDNYRQKKFEENQRARRSENHRSSVLDRADLGVAVRARREGEDRRRLEGAGETEEMARERERLEQFLGIWGGDASTRTPGERATARAARAARAARRGKAVMDAEEGDLSVRKSRWGRGH